MAFSYKIMEMILSAGRQEAGSSTLSGQLAKAVTKLDQSSSVISGLTAL